MSSRLRFRTVTIVVSLTYAAASSSLLLPAQVLAQDTATMTNVVPEGGNYSARGKLAALDPGAGTLTLVNEKAGTVPMQLGESVNLSNVSVGDVVDVHYTRSVTFVVGSPNVSVNNVAATSTVGQAAQTPGGIGPNGATIVGRVVKLKGPASFDVVNANGGGVYTIDVTNPARQAAVHLLNVGDSITVSVSPLIVTSIAKCGLFGMGLLGC